jgi:protease IV
VLEIAQGRVWSGTEAKKLGLVDEIGGLGKAITYAAEKAGLGTNYRLTEYPRKRQLGEIINEMMKGLAPDQAGDNAALAKLLGEFKDQARVLTRFNDPCGVYARLPVDIRIQ